MLKKPLKQIAGQQNNESRVFPLFIAGLVCFILATILGIGSWNIFGSQARQSGVTDKFLKKVGIRTTTTPAIEIATDTPKPEEKIELVIENTDKEIKTKEKETETEKKDESNLKTSPVFEGVVDVEGGEIAIGGGNTLRPLQRVFVESFLIAETEVTNSQFAEFVKISKYRSPKGWKNRKYPKNTENLPVVNVSWDDANAFCEWLTKRYEMQVRLPSQAEWELAARGPKRFKYPWGNDWNEDGVLKKKSSKPNEVKSFPVNKSPFGAYDMLGNVWEWTSEKILRKDMKSDVMKKVTSKNTRVYLAMGGSFSEERKKLNNTFWAELKAKTRNNSLGFRYVIISEEKLKYNDDGNTDGTK